MENKEEKYEKIAFHARPFAGEYTRQEICDKLERLYGIKCGVTLLRKACNQHDIDLSYKPRFNPLTGKLREKVTGERANKKNAKDTANNISKHVEEYLAKGGKITHLEGFKTDIKGKARAGSII